MLLNWFALLPECFLVLTLLILVVVRLWREQITPKTFYTLTKYGVFAAFVATIVFYKQAFWGGVYENSLASSLFKIFVYLSAAVTIFLSAKYFLSKDYSSFRFYFLVVLSLLLLTSALSSVDIRLTVLLLELGFLLNFYLIRTSEVDDDMFPVSVNFILYALFVYAVGAALSEAFSESDESSPSCVSTILQIPISLSPSARFIRRTPCVVLPITLIPFTGERMACPAWVNIMISSSSLTERAPATPWVFMAITPLPPLFCTRYSS